MHGFHQVPSQGKVCCTSESSRTNEHQPLVPCAFPGHEEDAVVNAKTFANSWHWECNVSAL